MISAPDGSPAIRCRSLVKRYGAVTAVDGLSLEVPRGECFGLLGPNGAGKTTTVEILEGLAEPTSGDVEVLGLGYLGDGAALRERIGVALQETQLAEKLTVAETIGLFASFYRAARPADDVIHELALDEKRDSWIGRLSGGQKQRVAVACALVGDPDILFLDEPTTGLDPQSRRQVWELVQRYKERGRTVILTTHYMDEAERLCDRIAIIDHGRIIALGTPTELKASLGGEQIVEFTVADSTSSVDPASAGAPGPGGGVGLDLRALGTLGGVRAARAPKGGGGTSLIVSELHLALPALLAHLQARGLTLTRLETHDASLEDVFVALTGRHLRDA